MTQRFGLTSLLLILALIYYSFFQLMPREGKPANAPAIEFSAQRALVQLQEIAQKPHFHANSEHSRVRDYLVGQLQKLGMEVELQSDPLLQHDYWNITEADSIRRASAGYHLIEPVNILGKIKGTGNGKALLLLSHYDSAKVPSPGASDAGSGIVTILEALRAYLAKGKRPVNDVIVLFTDAEELGLFGAKSFVQQHPWAKDVGLVLNFESRGSGGPGNMIVETNGGNARMIKAFAEASPTFPVASSLMYSVYKMLPNDTDSTVFREEGNIDSFFFAFIDDHFDYHTASDTVENLDVETLQHQGSYLLPLLDYFTITDLSTLKSDSDHVYVNLPHIFVHYPFSWIYPMLLIATVLLILLINYGFYLKRLDWRGIGRGMAALLISLVASGLSGYLGWKLIMEIYPQYSEIQHGFTYNGHSYIAFFVLLALAISIGVYRFVTKNQKVSSLFVAPLFLWILINAAVAVYLKGAAFFIIPVYFGLVSFWVLLRQKQPNLLLMTILAAPAILMFSPMIQSFPIGLGMKMAFVASVFTVLLFGLLYSVIGFYRLKKLLGWLCLLAAVFFFIQAHGNSDFDNAHRKPNSLIYYFDKETENAYWATYDHILDDWTRTYLGDDPQAANDLLPAAAGSKYNTGYTFAARAPHVDIEHLDLRIIRDSVSNGLRNLEFNLIPQRDIDELFIFNDNTQKYTRLYFNGLPTEVSDGQVQMDEFSPRLLRMNVARGDSLSVSLSTTQTSDRLQFEVISYAFDLMTSPGFTIQERSSSQMPKPFVNTDATVVRQILTFELPSTEAALKKRDSTNQLSDE